MIDPKPQMNHEPLRAASAVLPKRIWMLWLQGWEQAPEIVWACRRTWENNNPGWTVHALSGADLPHYPPLQTLGPLLTGKRLEPEALSDVIRIALLERFGGVWIDSTVYCLRPLDAWLPQKLSTGFFAFTKPVPERPPSSWFLAATLGHHIVREWYRRVLAYWQVRSYRHHYFWFHYLFLECCASDALFREIWSRTPQVLADADGPHHYIPYKDMLYAPVSDRDRSLIEGATTPVLKLTHRLRAEPYGADSVLGFLIARSSSLSLSSNTPPR